MWNRIQRSVVDGAQSDSVDVTSGVPRGTVLKSLMFYLPINYLPNTAYDPSMVRLFLDDWAVFYKRLIHKDAEQRVLQTDLAALEPWSIM